jgi:hypothetical protein
MASGDLCLRDAQPILELIDALRKPPITTAASAFNHLGIFRCRMASYRSIPVATETFLTAAAGTLPALRRRRAFVAGAPGLITKTRLV